MFRDSNWRGNEVVKRHPDGSINFDAYRAIARRERAAAIVSSADSALRAASAALASIGTALVGKAARHPAHHAK